MMTHKKLPFFSNFLHGDSIPGPLAPIADEYAQKTTAQHTKLPILLYFRSYNSFGIYSMEIQNLSPAIVIFR